MVRESEKKVELTIAGKIAFLALNRPNVYNAMNEAMVREILEALQVIKHSETDIVILQGNGKGFSAGGDIRAMIEEVNESNFDEIMDVINEMMITLYTLPKLVISAVHGAAAGLGFSFALASDYIIAEEATTFAMNFIQIGLIPDGGSHFFLQRQLGEAKSKQMIWEGKTISANQALALGLIHEVIEKDVHSAAKEKADKWLRQPIQTMLQSKRIFTEQHRDELTRILKMEKEGQAMMRKTADHQEGIRAFVEKRKATFIGK